MAASVAEQILLRIFFNCFHQLLLCSCSGPQNRYVLLPEAAAALACSLQLILTVHTHTHTCRSLSLTLSLDRQQQPRWQAYMYRESDEEQRCTRSHLTRACLSLHDSHLKIKIEFLRNSLSHCYSLATHAPSLLLLPLLTVSYCVLLRSRPLTVPAFMTQTDRVRQREEGMSAEPGQTRAQGRTHTRAQSQAD